MAPHQPFLSHWPIFSPWDTFISPQKADHSQHSCAVLDPIPNLDRTLMVLSSKYISAPLFFLSPSHTLRHHNLTWDSVFLSHLTSTLPYATLLLTPSPQTQSALDPVALVPGYQRKWAGQLEWVGPLRQILPVPPFPEVTCFSLLVPVWQRGFN